MTRYDPFAYGQVPLSPKETSAAPDDLLFADAGPVKQAPVATSDWGPPTDDAGAFRAEGGATQDALAFGADILGEAAPELAKPAPASKPASTRPAAPPLARPVAAGAMARPVPVPSATPGKASEPAAKAAPARRAALPLPSRGGSTMLGLVVPVAIVGVGGAVASWLAFLQQNPIMGVILGVTSLVGAAIARILLRG